VQTLALSALSARLIAGDRSGGTQGDMSKWWMGAFAAGVCLFMARQTHASLPRPVERCITSLDCDGCLVCVNWVCEPSTQFACLCDGECELYGYASCELRRPDQPLCYGSCSKSKPTSPSACGQGADAWILGQALNSLQPVPAAAILSTEQLSAQPASWTPVAHPEELDTRCSVPAAGAGSAGTALVPVVFALGLALRRRQR
jgi:hypothetical protein